MTSEARNNVKVSYVSFVNKKNLDKRANEIALKHL